MQKNVEKMTINYSPNFDLKKRDKNKIKYLIYHYTGMKSEKLAIKKLTSLNSNVSCHYFITTSGKLIQMVPDLYVAWHAGKSKWKNRKSLNYNSIGIEISNPGHEYGYRKFNDKQIKSLIKISKKMINKYKIHKKNILGHSDIAPLRKIDPGEKFPWKKLSKFDLGTWYKEKNFKINPRYKNKNKFNFFKNLYKIGYRYFHLHKRAKKDKLVIKAFQQRYRSSKVDGEIDQKTLNISHFLAN